MAQKPLVINRAIEYGESFRHHGSIIFKTPVPDNVRAEAVDGGIVLEQGGGNNLSLFTRARLTEDEVIAEQCRTAIIPAYDAATGALTIQIGEQTYVLDNLRQAFAASNPDNPRLSLDFRRAFAEAEQGTDHEIKGVTVSGPLGHSVRIVADGDVKIGDAGDRLRVTASGNVETGKTGRHPRIESGAHIYAQPRKKDPSP